MRKNCAFAAFVAAGMACAAIAAPAKVSPGAAAPSPDEAAAVRDRVAAGYVGAHLDRDTPKPEAIESPQVIYGADDRIEYWQIADPMLRQVADAACVVAFTSEVSFNAVAQTYSLSTSPWTTISGSSICTNEPFRGQPTVGFCSGFLVAPNLIATAGHCVEPGESAAFIFGFQVNTSGGSAPTVVPANNVYFAQQVIDWELSADDHSVVRIDRPVVGITPVRIRRSGTPTNGTPLIMIGHPATLPKKIDDGATIRDSHPSDPFFEANLDAYGGNSGSMVINANTYEVEGILVRGNTDYIFSGGCWRSNTLTDTNGSDWEECTKVSNFAASIPNPGLNVAGGPAAHSGPIGGPFSPASTVYTLSNTAAAPLNWTLDASGVAAFMTPSGPTSGTIAAGGSAQVTMQVRSSATTLSAGQYTGQIVFTDTTNSRSTNFTHTLDVGRRAYTWNGSVAIPDQASAQTFVNVPDAFQIADLDVSVNISHTYIGDLIVELTSPQGTVVRLHNRGGGSADNLVLTYNDEGTPPAVGMLSAFDGQNAQGNWRLFVSDNAGVDIGTINSVSLSIQQVPVAPPRNPADLFPAPNGDGTRDINDVLAFATAFNAMTPEADLSAAFGTFDINDVLAFANAFNLP